jgi:O-antigen/teichoic acid export membrane protein
MAYSDKYFLTDTEFKHLGSKTARRGFVAISGQAIVFAVQFTGITILARMLSPSDFGLVGMVTVLMLLIRFFRDFGLTKATMQRAIISRQEISNLFWINAGISLLLGALLTTFAPLIASFYGREELTQIAMVLAGGIVVEGLGLQHRALMMRGMQFGKLALCDVVGQCLSVAVALIAALYGLGYWALVLMPIVGSVTRLFFILWFTRWVPSMISYHGDTRSYLSFGGNLFGYNLLNYFLRNTDNILIGRFLGADAVGLYSYAYRLLMFPMQQLNGPMLNVMLPTFSRLQGEPDRFSVTYYKTVSMMIAVTFPFLGLAYAIAPSLFAFILGVEWIESAYLFQILAPAAFVTSLNVATDWVYLARGETNRMLKWALFRVPFSLICMVIGLLYGGVRGVAFSVSFSLCVLLVPYMKSTFKNTNLSLSRVLSIIGRAILPVFVSVLFAAQSNIMLVLDSSLFRLIIIGSAYTFCYICVDSIFNRSNSSLHQACFFLKKLKQPTV